MKKIVAVVTLILLSCSCATQTISVDSNNRREVPASNKPHSSQWNHFFFDGIGQSNSQNAYKICRRNRGVAFVEVRQSFGQVLLSAVTLGIYTPRTMNVYCNK